VEPLPAATLEDAAREAARLGGRALLRRFRRRGGLRVERKGPHDFVTQADREAEDAVTGYLRSRFPTHAILAEETWADAHESTYRWVVDPLDGTTNFIHGVATFAVSVAVEDRSGPVAGAIYDPVHRETFHARRGGGARLDDAAIACSRPEGLGECLLATGFPFRELGRLDRYLASFEAFVRTTAGLRRAGAAALDLAWVACGRYDGFWELGLSRWDVAAGALLVAEAGGRVTDPAGGATHLDCGDIVAAGIDVHGAMLEVTRRLLV
jgi:myo-inositol-1(or 4)-monophosphatase